MPSSAAISRTLVGEPADHDRDPLVRLLDQDQRLLELLPVVEDGVDARPLDGDAVEDLLGRDTAVHVAAQRRRDHVDRARLVEQLDQVADLRGAPLVIESPRRIDEQDIVLLQRFQTSFPVQTVCHNVSILLHSQARPRPILILAFGRQVKPSARMLSRTSSGILSPGSTMVQASMQKTLSTSLATSLSVRRMPRS